MHFRVAHSQHNQLPFQNIDANASSTPEKEKSANSHTLYEFFFTAARAAAALAA
jgi:hypothetical protein